MTNDDGRKPEGGYRKLWARLRFAGVRASPRRVRRVMRENGLLAPHRVGRTEAKPHDGTISFVSGHVTAHHLIRAMPFRAVRSMNPHQFICNKIVKSACGAPRVSAG